MGQGHWTPILDGELRQKALQSALEVVQALSQFPYGRESDDSIPEPVRSLARLDLGGGMAGAALLDGYLRKSKVSWPQAGSKEEEYRRCCLEMLDAWSQELGIWGGLYSGIPGVAWTICHLEESLSEKQRETLERIDEFALSTFGASPWLQEYDLISGLSGLGFYFLERAPHGRFQEGVEAAIDCLEETAEESESGITWFTPPERLVEHQRKMAPSGYYNLGLAHGVPGVVYFLARACAAGIETSRARPMLDGAVRWLLAQKLPENPRCAFDSWIASGVQPRPSRTAWCYGDLGVSVALLDASRRVGERSWEEEALALARKIAVRPFEQCGIADAGLCHGTAGNGHIFNRIYQATREPIFRDAAQSWFERTLSFRRPGEGIAGYFSWAGGAHGKAEWECDNSFLNGAAGIALGLLAACESVEPQWDRPMFISVDAVGP